MSLSLPPDMKRKVWGLPREGSQRWPYLDWLYLGCFA